MSYEIIEFRIHELSKENAISVNKALTESGAGKDFIANIKKCSSPSIDKVIKIADYFDVSIDYLLDRTNVKKPDKGGIKMDEIKRNAEHYRLLLSDDGIRRIKPILKQKIMSYGEERFYTDTGLTFQAYKLFMTDDVQCWYHFLSKFDVILSVLETNICDLLSDSTVVDTAATDVKFSLSTSSEAFAAENNEPYKYVAFGGDNEDTTNPGSDFEDTPHTT